jgi:hypothetical protein
MEVSADNGSNGACFHTSPTAVLKGSICELLERDALLSCWYADARLPVSRIDSSHPLYRASSKLAAVGWELNEHRWLHDKLRAACVAISLIRRRPEQRQWNFFLGGSASPRTSDAVRRAFSEVTRLYRSYHSYPYVVSPSGRIWPALLRSPISRIFLYQRPRYVTLFRDRLAGSTPVLPEDGLRLTDRSFVQMAFGRLPSLTIRPLPVPSSFVDQVYCIKATCSELQDIDWQIPPRYNLERLREVTGTGGRWSRLPHPMC